MNPLDALSALSNVKMPMAGIPALPTGPTAPGGASPISESFQNLLQPTGATQASLPTQPSLAPISGGGLQGPSTWGHMMHQMVMDVNSKQATAAQKIGDVLQGGPTPVHEAMVASEEASLSFEFLAEMRNKVVEAYQQVMQMQV